MLSEYAQYLTKPATLPVYLVPEFVHKLLPLSVLPDFVSSLLGGGHGSVELLPEPDQHPGIDNLIPWLVLLKMTSWGLLPGLQRTGCTLSTLMFHYLRQTQPTGATSHYHLADS